MTNPVRQAIDAVRALAGLPGRVAALERDIRILQNEIRTERVVVIDLGERVEDLRSRVREWEGEEARRAR